MIDHDNLDDFRDPQMYDVTDAGYYDDYPLIVQWGIWPVELDARPCAGPSSAIRSQV